jgi:23S rRNA pseudouridine2605 synthase
MLERLQKIIARAGIASRRHAEQLILSGQVRVNGSVITELGSKADAQQDRIEAAGKLIEANERRVYIVLNKPPEVVSTLADPEGRKTLRNCLKGLPERVYPVGRLDYTASGLVFLTNDGDLAAEMLRDWSNLQQSYHVKIKGRLLMDDLDRLGRNAGATIRLVRQPDATRGHAANFWYEVALEDSKKDILRRVLFAENHPVEKLKRIGLGPLTLEGLPQGRYRLLVEKEVDELRRALKIKPKPRYYPPAASRDSAPSSPSLSPAVATSFKTVLHRPAAGNFRPTNKFQNPAKSKNTYTRPGSNNVRSANKIRVLQEDDATSNSRGPKRFGGPPPFAGNPERAGANSFGRPNNSRDSSGKPDKFGRPGNFKNPNYDSTQSRPAGKFGRPNKFKSQPPSAGSNAPAANKFSRPDKFRRPDHSSAPGARPGSGKFARPNKFSGPARAGNKNRPSDKNRPASKQPFRPHRDKHS